ALECLDPFPCLGCGSSRASWRGAPQLRCTGRFFWLDVAVWSWMCGKEGQQKRSLLSPMDSP
uniref:Uncharacterized protein n=1 Tax=Sphaeramia orbicularis TaxID=375764 RepID=A0A673CVG8_9TELE